MYVEFTFSVESYAGGLGGVLKKCPTDEKQKTRLGVHLFTLHACVCCVFENPSSHRLRYCGKRIKHVRTRCSFSHVRIYVRACAYGTQLRRCVSFLFFVHSFRRVWVIRFLCSARFHAIHVSFVVCGTTYCVRPVRIGHDRGTKGAGSIPIEANPRLVNARVRTRPARPFLSVTTR